MYKKFSYNVLLVFMLCGLPISFGLLAEAVYAKKSDENSTTETKYNITLDEAVTIQANASARPITSLYSDVPAYVKNENVTIVNPVRLYGVTVDVRKEPSLNSDIEYQFLGTIPVYIKDYVVGDQYGNSALWYEIMYKQKKYYIHSSSVLSLQILAVNENSAQEQPSEDAHIFGYINKGHKMTVLDVEDNWYKIGYNYWRIPKKKDIRFYMDPNNTDPFQHIRLDAPINVDADELNNVLTGKGLLDGHGYAFIKGAKEHSINEAYLVAHALLETGNGTSPLATGIEVGENDDGELMLVSEANRENLTHIKTIYNMYGIGAADSCPVECGAITAYEQGWFTPEDAITNGAKWVGKDYIYNDFKQNTLYKMKWNPSMVDGYEWKQYATDIGWAEKQTTYMRVIYDQLDDPTMVYDLPVYKDE